MSDAAEAGALALHRLRKRRDFLRVARGHKVVRTAFVLQAAPGDIADGAGVGFTASRKIGGAVARNRAKRRLREVARRHLPRLAEPGHDYVLVARQAVLTCPFSRLEDELRVALAKLRRAR